MIVGRTAAHPQLARRDQTIPGRGCGREPDLGDGTTSSLHHCGAPNRCCSLARAVLHCTAGDMVIAAVTLVIALATLGNARWPDERLTAVAAAVIAAGVAYTIGSEYLNTVVRRSWTYTEWMPTLPWAGTGLAPLAQWVVVPAFALSSARRRPVTEGNAHHV